MVNPSNPSRDPRLVLRDAREGKISIERARRVYGIEVDPEFWTTIYTPFAWQDPGPLVDGELELVVGERQPANPVKRYVPAYEMQMRHTGYAESAGRINLRIGNPPDLVQYGGHIGYGVEPAHRGRHFAARAVRLLLPLARRHGMTSLIITCNPANIASRRSCELAGAQLLEIVDLPPTTELYARGERRVCRYRIELVNG